MSDLIPRLTTTLDSLDQGTTWTARRQHRRTLDEIRAAIEREHGRGLVVAARLDAGAHAARTGLINTGLLSKDEEQLLSFAPLGEARYKAIVDTYAIFAAGEIGRL